MLRELAKLREQGIVVPSNSNYASALWIVPKKPDSHGNKKFRLVTDFRALNEETEGSCHPLPFTSDILEHLATANYITVMDLKQGYHQLEMHPESAHLTAFYAPDGKYGHELLQFNRMAMGLKEATITFTRAMSLAMKGLQGEEVEIYLDDLMVFSETLDEHKVRLRRVLKRLLEANMTVEPKKCQFLKKEAHVLGHIVGGGLIKTDPEKVRAMANYPVPTDPRKLKQALGLFSYYRRFIKDFSKIARPLFKLLQKGEQFIWGEEQQAAFDELRELMLKEPVLKAPDLSQPFIVTTDSSDWALGAILSQGKLGADQPCAYASRCLKGSELKYPTYDKELLAIVFAKDQFRCYLYGRKFTIVTDHESLKHFHQTKKPDLRFNRLKAALVGYDFDIVYRPGIKNANADAFSRNPVINEGEVNPELPRIELYNLADRQIHESPDEEAGAPPGRIFRARAIRKQGIDTSKKIKQQSSSSASSTSDKKKQRNDSALIYKSGETLAVRNDLNDFYLCRTLQDVYHGTSFLRIRWFTETPKRKNVYMLDYCDKIKYECILTNVTLKKIEKNKYLLMKSERARIHQILKESIKFCSQNDKKAQCAEGKMSTSCVAASTSEMSLGKENTDRATRSSNRIQSQRSCKLFEPNESSNSERDETISPAGKASEELEPLQTFSFPINKIASRDGSVRSVAGTGEAMSENLASFDVQPAGRMESNSALVSPADHVKTLPCEKSFSKQRKDLPATGLPLTLPMSGPWFGDKSKTRLAIDIQRREFKGKSGLQYNIYERETTATEKSDTGLSQPPETAHTGKNKESSGARKINSDGFNKSQVKLDSPKPVGPNKPKIIEDIIIPSTEYRVANAIMDAQVDPENVGPVEDFSGIPRMYDRKLESSEENSSVSSGNVLIQTYIRKKRCAEPRVSFIRSDDIPDFPPGNCLFFSLLKLTSIGLSTTEIRRQLLESPLLQACGEPAETERILRSDTEYGTVDCAFLFAHTFSKNICVHYNHPGSNRVIFCHIIAPGADEFLHLNLEGRHFTPYLRVSAPTPSTRIFTQPRDRSPSGDSNQGIPGSPIFSKQRRAQHRKPVVSEQPFTEKKGGEKEPTASKNENEAKSPCSPIASPLLENWDPPSSDGDSNAERRSERSQPIANEQAIHFTWEEGSANTGTENLGEHTSTPVPVKAVLDHDKLKRYVVAKGRPPREKPPWLVPEDEEPPPFVHLRTHQQHPFRFKENLVYLISADDYISTEIQEALTERGYLNPDDLLNKHFKLGEVNITECQGIKLIGLYIKAHIDDRPLRADIRKCLRTLKNVLLARNITSIAIVRDLEMLTLAEWSKFIDLFDEVFSNSSITAVLLKNNVPVPPASERFKIIKEYHEAANGGHRGRTKTYSKVANDFYWRNMRADIKQFVARCATCISNKLVRVKTRLPMLISNTPAMPFAQIALDFYGPLETSKRGNKYILSVQDMLTKYVILVPTKHADADEVVRALTEKVICVFGPPAAIVSDQGRHFQNKTLEKLAEIFEIEKFHTTAYHPAGNGSIERMHHTLTEYMRKYVKNIAKWDDWTAICQHAYNCTEHESTRYTPHELLFGTKPRTPSSFPRVNDDLTYNEYIEEMTANLTALQTTAAMNLVQSKYRSKHYYDRKLNLKHFREGETVFLLKEPKKGKFAVEYQGPFEVLKVNRKTNNVTIGNGDVTKTVHINKLERPSALARQAEASEEQPED